MTDDSAPARSLRGSQARSSLTDPPPIGLLRIDHVGIAVPDLDKAIEFYERSFGMRCVHTEVNAEQGVREAMLAIGDGPDRVQLLAPAGPESTIAKFPKNKPEILPG